LRFVLDQTQPSIYDFVMSSDDITAYLNALDQPKRATLQKLRETILDVIPEAA
jgi:hypothetical protein